MIDEIRITGLETWPEPAREQLHRELYDGDFGVAEMGEKMVLYLPEQWPKLRRENLKHQVQKTLAKAEHDHGLEATVLSIEKTEKDDRDLARFE